MEHCFIRLKDLDTKKIGAEVSGELWNVVRMGKIKWSEEVTNEQVMGEMVEVKGVG